MANSVKLGSINFPKLMRQVGHRTNQVRDLVFIRDPIFEKETKTTKEGGNLTGPAVNFGYENNLNTSVASGTTDKAYHVITPELVLPGLKAVQTPIISRSGELERTGHRITGACTFYMPSLSYIRSLPEFSETTQFDELETYDKLMDMERIIVQGDRSPYNDAPYFGFGGFNPTQSLGTSSSNGATLTIYDKDGNGSGSGGFYPAGYEVDRFQSRLKRGAASGSSTAFISKIALQVTGSAFGGGNPEYEWTPTAGNGAPLPTSQEYITIDVPFNVKMGSTTSIYIDGTRYEYTIAHKYSEPYRFDTLGEIIGDSTAYLKQVTITCSNTDGSSETNFTVDSENTFLYKTAEWRVESIKDYRDEYMEVAAVRVRGNRTSRRRAYG